MIGLNKSSKYVGVLIFILIPMFFCILSNKKNPFPGDKFKQTINALSQARSARADVYSQDLYNRADEYFHQALEAVQKQNSGLFARYNYSEALSLAENSILLSRNAYNTALLKQDSIEKEYRTSRTFAEEQVKKTRDLIKYFPSDNPFRANLVQTELMLLKGNEAYKRAAPLDALISVQKAVAMADSINTQVRENLTHYFAGLDFWQKLANDAINNSKTDSNAVLIVDKLAHKCKLYLSGVLYAELDAEFGPNWIGNKVVQGDQKTPEGKYRVIGKKDGHHTKYYKALEIDYPNEIDKQRFDDLLRRKVIGANSKIGGMIEIHGGGGRGFNWTDGCIALSNNDMDLIYKVVTNETTVLIVGSLNKITQFTTDAFLK